SRSAASLAPLLEDPLERGEVLLGLALDCLHHEPFGESEEPARLAVADDVDARPTVRGLELVVDLELDRSRDDPEREAPVRLVLRDLERRLDPLPEELAHLDHPRAGRDGAGFLQTALDCSA